MEKQAFFSPESQVFSRRPDRVLVAIAATAIAVLLWSSWNLFTVHRQPHKAACAQNMALTQTLDLTMLFIVIPSLLFGLAKAAASARRLSQLEGLITVCSHCRRLRDEKSSYHRMEAFFQKNSHFTFSHGICPDCMERHYPE